MARFISRSGAWLLGALSVVMASIAGVRAHEPEPEPDDEAHKTVVTHGRPGFTPKVGGLPLELARPRTAEEALELVPGVVVVQHGNEGKAPQLYLRGFDALHGADFEVLLEGVRLNEHSNVHATGYFDLTLVPVSLLRDVTVDKGPFGLDQGLFGTAGTARYRLGVESARRGYRVGYEVGTTGRHSLSLSVSPDDPNDDSMLGVELTTDHGFGERRGVRRLAAAARVAPPADGPDTLALFVALGLARFELPGLIADADVTSDFVDFHGAYEDRSRGESDRVLAVLSHVHERDSARIATSLHVGWRGLLLRENFTGFLAEPERGDARLQTERRLHAGLASDVHIHLSDHVAFEGYAGFRWDGLTQTIENVDELDQVFATERVLDADLFEAWLAPGLRLEGGPWSARLGARLTLADHRPVGGHDTLFAVLPRIDLAWRASPWTLRVAYGRSARPPEARASTVAGDTRPEMTLSDAIEVGVRWRVDRLEASLAGFLTFVGHESVFDHASGQSLELDSSRRLGLELQLVYVPVDPLRLRLDLTVADARYDRSGRHVAGVPTVLGSLQAELAAAPWRVFVRALAIGSRPLPHGAMGSGLFDLSLGADWTSGPLRVGLVIDNALDLEQRNGVYHFASYWDARTDRSSLPRLSFAAGAPFSARLTLELVP